MKPRKKQHPILSAVALPPIAFMSLGLMLVGFADGEWLVGITGATAMASCFLIEAELL